MSATTPMTCSLGASYSRTSVTRNLPESCQHCPYFITATLRWFGYAPYRLGILAAPVPN